MTATATETMSLTRVRPGSSTRRRSSSLPGFFTRADVERDLRITASELETFERAGILVPSERRERGNTRPVLYSGADLAVGRVAMAAHKFGIRGESLRKLVEAVRLKQRRLTPGWVGSLVVDYYGDVELVPEDQNVATEVSSRNDVGAILVLRIQVPDDLTSQD